MPPPGRCSNLTAGKKSKPLCGELRAASQLQAPSDKRKKENRKGSNSSRLPMALASSCTQQIDTTHKNNNKQIQNAYVSMPRPSVTEPRVSRNEKKLQPLLHVPAPATKSTRPRRGKKLKINKTTC